MLSDREKLIETRKLLLEAYRERDRLMAKLVATGPNRQGEAHWNYRVVRRGNTVAIYEVYYVDGKLAGVTEAIMDPVVGDDVADLRADLELMLDALDKPVLEYDDIGKAGR